MEPRIDYARRYPEVRNTMWALEHYVHQSGLDPKLLELVKLRASLVNGCAYCVDMHTKVARSLGETEQRLYEVSLWREAPFYTDRERAALAWTEAVTLVSIDHVPDDVYEAARQQFDDKELVDLTAAIVAINGWNRLAIAFRTVPGTFQIGRPAPGDREAHSTSPGQPTGGGPMITLKRVYDPVSRPDGTRFLVERLWPRGLAKAKVHVDGWLKDVAPSTELRKWFGHDPDKWDEFWKRYRRELDSRPDAWQPIVSAARRGPVTLVYSSHDTEHNNAVALREYLEAKMHRSPRAAAADRPRRRSTR